MVTKIIDTATNLKSVLLAKSTYFIVEDEIQLQGIHYTLGTGSVIAFIGGRFRGTFGTSLDLNKGQVIAAPYSIFANMEVTGFGNSEVYAEWFNDNNNTTPHVYINKALRCAKGCPVLLTQSVYKLRGSIVFPNTSESTLIASGSLEIDNTVGDASWKGNPIAIDINVSNVHLDINRIGFPGKKIDNEVVVEGEVKIEKVQVPDKGTGIRISGNVSHVTLKVNTIVYPEKGIDITPGQNDGNTQVSYLNVEFQYIYAIHRHP